MANPPLFRLPKKVAADKAEYRGVYKRQELKQFLLDWASWVFESVEELNGYAQRCHATLGGRRIRPDPEVEVEFVDGERLILTDGLSGKKLVFFFRNNKASLLEYDIVIVKGKR